MPAEGQGEGKADYDCSPYRDGCFSPCSSKGARKARAPRNMARTAVAPRSVGQGVADAFNLLVCAGSPVAIAGGASALVAVPAFLLSALRGTMEGWVQL